MVRAYSIDLRERVLAAVANEGMSARGAAARFGISESSAIKWVKRHRQTGAVAPVQIGSRQVGVDSLMPHKRIRSLERGVTILQFVNTMGEATAGKIAREIGLPRPTVYRILDTLVESGLLYRSPSAQRVYRLTEAVGKLSTGLGDTDPVVAATRRVLHNASPDLSWPVFLSTYTEEGMVILETTRGSSVFWTELGWVGAIAPFWEVSAGWAFVAHASPELQNSRLEHAPPNARDRLDAVREKGYAVDLDSAGRVVGMSVAVGDGKTLVGSLATFWEASERPDPALIDDVLTSLVSLRNQILQELKAIA